MKFSGKWGVAEEQSIRFLWHCGSPQDLDHGIFKRILDSLFTIAIPVG